VNPRVLLAVATCAALGWGCAQGVADGGYVGGDASTADASGRVDAGGQAPDSGETPSVPPGNGQDAGDAGTAPDSSLALDAAAPTDSQAGLDSAFPSTDSAPPVDTSPPDSALAATDSGEAPDVAIGLDPELGLPDPSGVPCSTPGLEVGCPNLEVCRIDSQTGGRCEGCTSCNNLYKPCTVSSDCDILFQCYEGECTNICPLGTSYCGPVANCLDVGNTAYGVCKPM
jgi:hypothetical protein